MTMTANQIIKNASEYFNPQLYKKTPALTLLTTYAVSSMLLAIQNRLSADVGYKGYRNQTYCDNSFWCSAILLGHCAFNAISMALILVQRAQECFSQENKFKND